jgi:adenylosuccinate lyase
VPAGAVDRLETQFPRPKGSSDALISRYTRPAMGAVWSDERKFQRWLDVEIAAMAAWAELGVVPETAVKAVRTSAQVDVARIGEIEARTHHDVLAFTESVAEQVGEPARWFHYGLTSSDIVDTALALQMRDAGELIVAAIADVERATLARAEEFRHTPTIGRTHGVHAEPTTFGLKLLGWATELQRQRERLVIAFESVRVGKLSGAVGAYANSDPRVEASALDQLGLEREEVATQVVPRDRHAALLSAIAGAGASLERFALEIRHLQRTEVREAREPFAKGQKGSSAMPHKQNPIVCERICGLARVLRANAQVGLEDVALWHERDISHSSAERIVIPDSTIILDYMLDRMLWLVQGLVVDAERMLRNLEASHGLVFSGRVLLQLVEAGLTRERAYAVVQRNALRAWEEELPLRALLEADPEAAVLSAHALDQAFDLDSFLRFVDEIFDRTLQLSR